MGDTTMFGLGGLGVAIGIVAVIVLVMHCRRIRHAEGERLQETTATGVVYTANDRLAGQKHPRTLEYKPAYGATELDGGGGGGTSPQQGQQQQQQKGSYEPPSCAVVQVQPQQGNVQQV